MTLSSDRPDFLDDIVNSNDNQPPKASSERNDGDSQSESSSDSGEGNADNSNTEIGDATQEITPESVLDGMSKRNLKHSRKYLEKFQNLSRQGLKSSGM
ncbi:MAG: hypothetical protein ACRC2S_29335 [Waterburya sp.]